MRPRALPPELATRAFTVAMAHDAGVTDRRLRASDLDAPFHGIRRARPVDGDSALQAVEDYAPRLRPGQFFSHATAAAIWRIPLPSYAADELHVSAVPPHREPRTRGVLGHRLHGGDGGLTVLRGVPVTTPAETWAQLGAMLTLDELIAAGDFLIGRERLATLDGLGAASRRIRRHGIGLLEQALMEVRTGSESPRETDTRLVLVRGGMPQPELNWVLRDRSGGFVARLDMAYPRYRVGVEYDGRQHAEDARQFARDADRWAAIEAAGWITVRVLSHHFRNPDRDILERTRRSLIARGWSP